MGGFSTLERSSLGGRRAHRSLPKGLLAASLIVLAGIAAVGAVVVLKPWAHRPSAVDALAAQSVQPPAPLTISKAPDPFAANAPTAQATVPAATPSSVPAPVKTAAASLAPHAGRARAPAAAAPQIPSTILDPSLPAASDTASQPAQAGTAQAGIAASAPPKVSASMPIVVTPPPAADAKPVAVQPTPAKVSTPPPKTPPSETISTAHLPGSTVGPQQ
jgi:hypothetical protein